MNTAAKWSVRILGGGAILSLAIWGLMEGRAEQARERENEAPVHVPPRLEQLPDGGMVVKLEPAALQALGLKTLRIQASPVEGAATIFGVVLDPLPWLDLQGKSRAARQEVLASAAALDAATKALERIRIMHAEDLGASDKALQEAEARVKSEEARHTTAMAEENRLQAAWKQQGLPSDLGPFTSFRQALLRVDLPLGQAVPPSLKTLPVKFAGEASLMKAQVLGLASTAGNATGGFALMCRVDAPNLRPGQPMEAYLPLGTSKTGLVVPGSALLWAEGRTWAYVQRPDGRYERRALRLLFPVSGGYAVETGLRDGDQVVVRGAEGLLAEEFKSRIVVGEDKK